MLSGQNDAEMMMMMIHTTMSVAWCCFNMLTCTHTFARTHTCIHSCVCTRTDTYIHTSTHMRTHAQTHTHTHVGGTTGCALDAALAIWLDRCGELQGRYRLTVAVTALGLLMESGQPRLEQIMVCGCG